MHHLGLVLSLLTLTGCGQAGGLFPHSSTHTKLGWKAEDYFADPQVIALCKAIEADDIPEIDRLVAAGADVNAQGKGKMTPLLWAFPDNKLDRFKRLLELGANPNVITESDFDKRGVFMAGDSVTHMACETAFPGYFEAVFDHGGDPNLVKQTKVLGRGDTPLLATIISRAPHKKEHIRLLLDKGADINYHAPSDDTVAMRAVGASQFDIVLMLLERGADFKLVTNDDANTRLMHQLLVSKTHGEYWTAEQRAGFDAVVRLLEDHGDSAKEAQADLDRWAKWSVTKGDYQRNMAAEVAERKRREAEAKQKQADADIKPEQ